MRASLDATLAQAQAELDTATSQIEQAERDLERTKIIAPFDGRVLDSNVDIGFANFPDPFDPDEPEGPVFEAWSDPPHFLANDGKPAPHVLFRSAVVDAQTLVLVLPRLIETREEVLARHHHNAAVFQTTVQLGTGNRNAVSPEPEEKRPFRLVHAAR